MKKNNLIKGTVFLLLFLGLSITLFTVLKNPVGFAVGEGFSSNQDLSADTVETSEYNSEVNLTSTQNNHEIKITKFISTKKKFTFDYEFKIEDDYLKELLEKQLNADDNSQHIQIGLFANSSTEDLYDGVSTLSTFRVEDDTFYGSVIATFDTEKIPENAELTLHIYKLSWQDRDEFEAGLSEYWETGSGFSVDTALHYEGDWTYNIKQQPLTQTSETQISNVNNITDFQTSNDPLQTTISFTILVEEWTNFDITLYKNGKELETRNPTFMFNSSTGEAELVLDLSSLDKDTIYTVEITEEDGMGQEIRTVGSFDVQNK